MTPTHNGVTLGANSPLLTLAQAKRKLTSREADEQRAVITVLVGKLGAGEQRAIGNGMTARYPGLMLLYAINPNRGGQKSRAARGMAKAMGELPGIPDLCLPVAREGYFGLYLEMKRADGRVTPDQTAMHAALVTDRGFSNHAYRHAHDHHRLHVRHRGAAPVSDARHR